MFEVLKGLNYEEANSVAYYTVKALNNINIDELMKINKDGDQRVSDISKMLARNIILRSRNSTEGVNQFIREMNDIIEDKPVIPGDICVSGTRIKTRKRMSAINKYFRKMNQLHSCNWRSNK